MSQLSFLLNKLCYKRDISLLKVEYCNTSLKKFIKFNFTKNFQSETKICEIPHCVYVCAKLCVCAPTEFDKNFVKKNSVNLKVLHTYVPKSLRRKNTK